MSQTSPGMSPSHPTQPPPRAEPPVEPLGGLPLPGTTLHTSYLWLVEKSSEDANVASSMSFPLKSLAAAAAEAKAGSKHADGGAAAADSGHLLAASRRASQELHVTAPWLSAKKQGQGVPLQPKRPASSVASPRIAALPAPATRPETASQGQADYGLGGLTDLLCRLSEHLQLPAMFGGPAAEGSSDAGKAGAAAGAAAAAAASASAAGAAATAAAAAAVAEEGEALVLVVESEGEDEQENSSLNAWQHASPAHLIAPKPATLPWQASPPAGPEGQQAGAGAVEEWSGTASTSQAGSTSPVVVQQQQAVQGQKQVKHSQEQQAAVEEQREEQQQRPDGQQPDGQQPPSPPCEQQSEAESTEAAVPLPEPSGLSSPSSGSYSPAVAAARHLAGSSGQRQEALGSTGSAAAGQCDSGGASAGSGWQRAREEGQVRRSLAHPIFELQPEPGEAEEAQRRERKQGQGAIAGLEALIKSQHRMGGNGSPPASASQAWSLGSSHIQFDLLAAGSLEAALPEAAGEQASAPHEQGGRNEWAQPAGAASGAASGQYAALFQKFQALKLKGARKAVKASLKEEQLAAAAPRPSLLRRFSSRLRRDGGHGSRKELERQQVHLLCLGRIPFNLDEPLHFELWQAVCSAYAGLAAASRLPGSAGGPHGAYQLLGFGAPNPAHELGDTGVLALMLLLFLADRAPQLASQLLEASVSNAEAAAGQAGAWPAVVALHATGWTLRLLRSGELGDEAQRAGSASAAAERFFLGAIQCFLRELRSAGPQERRLPPRRFLLAVLGLAEERACGDVAAAAAEGAAMA